MADEPKTDTTTAKTETPTPVVDPSDGFRAALKKHEGDATSLARDSWVRAQESARQVADLQGKLPKSGAVILEGDDAAEWAEYRKLGKATEVVTKLGTLGTLETTIAAHDREKLLGQAAKAHGFDPEVLATLAGDLRIELKDGKDRLGKDAKVAEVVSTVKDDRGEKEERTPLDKFAEKAWAKFLPSLKSASDAKTTPNRVTSTGLPRTEVARDINPARPLRPGRV
jgi:hypothetical protein